MKRDCGADMRMPPWLVVLVCLLAAPIFVSARYHPDSKTSVLPRIDVEYKPGILPSDRGLILADREDDNNDGREFDSNGGKRWEDLTPKQQRNLEKRYEKYKSLPRAEQERIKSARQKYRELPPEKRRELRDQYRKSKRRQDND